MALRVNQPERAAIRGEILVVMAAICWGTTGTAKAFTTPLSLLRGVIMVWLALRAIPAVAHTHTI